MKFGGFVMLTVSIAVAVLTLSSVLVPAVSMAVDTEDTFTNTGYWRMKALEDGDVWTLTNGNWTYGDETIVESSGSSGYNMVLGDTWCIRAAGHVRSAQVQNANTNLSNATVTVDDELVIVSKTDTQWSRNLPTPGYGADNEGAFVITKFDSTDPQYVNGDTAIYGSGVSTVDNCQLFVHVEGTIDDGATYTAYASTGAGATTTATDIVITNTTINYTEVNGYKDLYKLSSITCDIAFNTLDADSNTVNHTGNISFSSYVIPYEITAEKAIHADSATRTLFQIIPIFMVLAILLGIVAVLYVKYRK